MTRATYRFRAHALTADETAEADPTLYAMECKGCGQSSDGAEEAKDGTEWAADHFKANPSHPTYREHIARSYRFEPREWL
ncbi:DUF7848 domain-containing protein [Streptomyces sp. H39-S7]|uniref:DUF7848 domain-containing protein n=1 Tax=Streptomyces sp. H39-S7 TaxID=3004357 RepID=UPI0022AE5413|nr:hypothetical protein [Streptomyces sp. H39-S7]MCZ4117834.1 hypothetical protein [Streptomyces sp. H39-S7]